MSVRKTFARVLGVAVLVGLMGVLLPAGPVSAVPQCQWEREPRIDCPPMRPPTRPPSMQPGAPGMTPMPDPRRMPADELCARVFVRNGLFIVETGVPDKLIYSIDIDASICRRHGVTSSPAITSVVTPINSDIRITNRTSSSTAFQRGLGTTSFTQREHVFFTACGDRTNAATCKRFEHFVDIIADAEGSITARSGVVEAVGVPI